MIGEYEKRVAERVGRSDDGDEPADCICVAVMN